MADSDIIVSLHLVIPFISMVGERSTTIAVMDRLKLTGRNLGRVFSSGSGRVHATLALAYLSLA